MKKYPWIKSGLTVLFLIGLIGGMFTPGAAPVLAAQLKDGTPPTIGSVDPSSAPNDLDTPITITGSNFSSDAVIDLNHHLLTHVTLQDASTLTATVPWGLADGDYTLTITTPGGSAATDFIVNKALGQWNTSLLFGGSVFQMVKVDNTFGSGAHLFAEADTGGIFFSGDGGENWTLKGNVPGHPGGEVTLTVDPNNENNIFDAQYKSLDGGLTWSNLMPEWMDGKGLGDLIHTYINNGTYYAISAIAKDSEFADDEGSGIAKSTDNGSTWTNLATSDMDDTNVTALAFVPGSSPTKIYAGTSNGKVYYSEDDGASWSLFHDFALDTQVSSVGVLAVNPFAPTELWVSTKSHFSDSAAMVKIDTESKDISPVWGDPNQNDDQTGKHPVSIVFTNSNTAYLGMNGDPEYKTSDGGANWTDFSQNDNSLQPNGNIIWDQDVTFFEPDGRYGIQKTSDDGATWTVKDNGIQAMVPFQMAVDPTNPAYVYANIRGGGWPGIFKTSDGGANWTFVEFARDSVTNDDMRPKCIAVDGSGKIYMGVGSSAARMLYTSIDHGVTWNGPIQVVTNPQDGTYYSSNYVKANPKHPGTLLMEVSTHHSNDDETAQIYRSTDYGATWQPGNLSDSGQPAQSHWGVDLVFDPQNADRVYMSMENKHMFVSTDNGANWTRLNSFTNSGIPQGFPMSVESIPPYRLIAFNGYSDDQGKTWHKLSIQDGGWGVAFLPHSATVYSGGANGLLVSTDSGSHWQPVAGPLGSANIQSLAVADTLDRALLYVGTAGSNASVSSAASGNKVKTATDTPLTPGTYRYGESRLLNLLSPADGSDLQTKPSSIHLVWQMRPEAKSYRIDFSKYSNFSKFTRFTTTKTNYTLSSKYYKTGKLGDYYWRVSYTLDKAGKILSDPSNVHSFSVPLLAPKLSLPKSNAKLLNTSLPFTWKPSTQMKTVDHYEIQVSTSTSFKSLEVNDVAAGPAYTITASLAHNVKHYWRVRGISASGQYTLWSSPWAFKITP